MGNGGKLQLKRDLRALGQRYEFIKDSNVPEDKKEAQRLLRLHEQVRLELVGMAGSGEE